MIDKKTGHITLAEDVVITENTTLQEFEKAPYFDFLSDFSKGNLNDEILKDTIHLKPIVFDGEEYILKLGFSLKNRLMDLSIVCMGASNLYAIKWDNDTMSALLDKQNKLLKKILDVPEEESNAKFKWGRLSKVFDLHNTRLAIEIVYYWH